MVFTDKSVTLRKYRGNGRATYDHFKMETDPNLIKFGKTLSAESIQVEMEISTRFRSMVVIMANKIPLSAGIDMARKFDHGYSRQLSFL